MFAHRRLEVGRAARKLSVWEDVEAALLKLAPYAVALRCYVRGRLREVNFLFERERRAVFVLFVRLFVHAALGGGRLERLHDVEREVFEPVPVALVFVG